MSFLQNSNNIIGRDKDIRRLFFPFEGNASLVKIDASCSCISGLKFENNKLTGKIALHKKKNIMQDHKRNYAIWVLLDENGSQKKYQLSISVTIKI